MKRQILIDHRGDRSQKDMAKLYNVTQQAYNKWEIGRSTPTHDKMRRIAIDIGRPMEEIFSDVFFPANGR